MRSSVDNDDSCTKARIAGVRRSLLGRVKRFSIVLGGLNLEATAWDSFGKFLQDALISSILQSWFDRFTFSLFGK
tara:strand:- start:103 stop:327 length:225 start_codon:yes stop_codon:yes gene_type:complete